MWFGKSPLKANLNIMHTIQTGTGGAMMSDKTKKLTTRRSFLKKLATGGAAGVILSTVGTSTSQSGPRGKTIAIPESKGYITYDSKKCAGCRSCMLACSMVHEGKTQLSLSRIQVIEDPFGAYPNDISIAACKQCKEPSCLTACPVNAIYVDKEHMNVRRIDKKKCKGAQDCVKACHFSPSRVRFDPVRKKALKCDLCKDTPYWRHEKGKLACIEVCPVKALAFTSTPVVGYHGYEVNLRGEGWKKLDLPTD